MGLSLGYARFSALAKCTHVACLGLVFALLSEAFAHAFTLNSDDHSLKGWNTTTLKINYNPSDCPANIDLKQIMLQAIDVWNNVPAADIRLELGNVTSTTPGEARSGEAKDFPVVVCDQRFKNTTNMDANVVPGVGGIAVNSDSHRIVYGYSLLNAEDTTSADIGHLANERVVVVVAHEIGHVLGLGHSKDHGSLMFPNVSNLHKASLSLDDIAGLRHLYPPGHAEIPGMSCASLTDLDEHDDTNSFLQFAAFILLVAIGSRMLKHYGKV